MKEELFKLIDLSHIDAEIDSLAEQRDEIPVTIAELEAEIQTVTGQLSFQKSELQQSEASKKLKQSELAEKREWINGRQEKVKDLKTNKEYHASVKEVELATKACTQLESDIQNLDARIAELAPKIADAEQGANDKQTNLQNEIQQKKDAIHDLEKQINEKIALRNQVETLIPAEYLNRYKSIKNRLTPAMTMADDGNCHECFTRIPPQQYIEIQKFNQLIICPRCHRILYLESTARS